MVALSVLLAIVMGVALLFGMTLVAVLATWLLAQMFDVVARAQAATDFAVLYSRVRSALLEHQEPILPNTPTLIVLCKEPLTKPEYFVGLAGRNAVFTARKVDAKCLELGDLAVKQWVYVLEERHGYLDVFVCFAPQTVGASTRTHEGTPKSGG